MKKKLLVVVLASLFAPAASAQTFSDAQKVVLKAAILGDAGAAALYSAGSVEELAAYLNVMASPTYTAWKPKVTLDEITGDPAFTWSRVDNLSVGKARIWDWMWSANTARTINAGQSNIRAGIDATWVGTQADLDVRASVYTHLKKAARRWEKMLATGTGSDASPGVLGTCGSVPCEGSLNYPVLIGL